MSASAGILRQQEQGVPDQDRLPKGLAPGWRKPYRLIVGGQATQDVAGYVLRALAATLRHSGGIPAFEALFRAIDRVAAMAIGLFAPSRDHFRAAVDSIDRTVVAAGSHHHTQVASVVAKRFLSVLQAGPHNHYDRRSFAYDTCVRLIQHYLLSHRSAFVREGAFPDLASAGSFESALLNTLKPNLESMARRISDDPGCSRLRGSGPKIEKRSTADLLDTNLLA